MDPPADADDPLALRNLAVSYDYLMFKINDHIASLAEQTHQSVLTKQNAIEKNYLQDQLKLDQEIAHIDALIASCNELELEFMKLDQIQQFVSDFKERLTALEDGFGRL